MLELARIRIKNNIDINAPLDKCNTNTLLHYATAKGNPNLVQLLIDHGADVNLKNTKYESAPLHWARFSLSTHTYDIYKLLLEMGANCKDVDSQGDTPLHLALMSQPLKIIKLLLDYGADVKAVTCLGRRALHYAALNSHLDVVEFMLEQGFDVNYVDKCGDSPLHRAASFGSPEACVLLLRRGAMVDAKNAAGDTPFDAAVKFSRFGDVARLRIVELLLDYGADWTCEIGHQNVLDIAADNQPCSVRIRQALVLQVAKSGCLSSNGRGKNSNIIEKEDWYKELYPQCLNEIERMKTTKFYNNVSIFTMMMGSDQVISGFARNEELAQALEEKDYGSMFPIYFTSLKRRFYAEVTEQNLRKSAEISLASLWKLNDPFHPIIRKVLSYIRHEDLKYLSM